MTEKNIQCETCAYYQYDDEYEDNICAVNFDEDDMCAFLSQRRRTCPYYKYYDEYGMVRKQN